MLEMTRKMSATKACTCIVLAVMCLDLCKIGQCMNLMRFEVMERDDLAILYQSRLMNQVHTNCDIAFRKYEIIN